MSEREAEVANQVVSDPVADPADAALDGLRAQGAQRLVPVRLRYLEALAARMRSQPEAVREQLAIRFDAALADCRQRCEREKGGSPAEQAASRAAQAVSPLAALNREIAARAMASGAQARSLGLPHVPGPAEMKSVRRFAETWSRIATERRLQEALTRGPESAGPLNSHNLMLRAMSLMHGLSPDYLRHFLAQAEALLWLDQMNQLNTLGKDGKDGKAAAARKPRGKKQG